VSAYEAMFLVDGGSAPNWESVESEVRRVLDRASAKVLGLKKWDERKLAYEVRHRKRGTYILVFFEAPPEKIAGIEHDAKISEVILRLLVLRHERLTPEAVEKAMTAAPPPRAPERMGESWAPRGGREGDRGRERGPRPEEEAEPAAPSAETAELEEVGAGAEVGGRD